MEAPQLMSALRAVGDSEVTGVELGAIAWRRIHLVLEATLPVDVAVDAKPVNENM
jgi:hypothetical protein